MTFELKNKVCWAREIVQWLRGLAALLEDLGLILSTLMAGHNHLKLQTRDLTLSSGLWAHKWYTQIHVGQIPICIKQNKRYGHFTRIKLGWQDGSEGKDTWCESLMTSVQPLDLTVTEP